MPEDEKVTETTLKQLVENNGQVYSEQADEGGEVQVYASGIKLGTRKGLLLKTRGQAEKHIRYATATHVLLTKDETSVTEQM